MNERELKEQYSDEIDLYEMILVLKKRIKLIVAVVVFGVIIGGMVTFLSPDIYQARATLWVDYLLTQSMLENVTKADSKVSFIIPLERTKTQDINNLSISILNSLEFKKKVLAALGKEEFSKDDIENLSNAIKRGKGEALFKAEINTKTGSINLTSEQKDKKLTEEILKVAIEQFRGELEKALFSYFQAIAQDKQTFNGKYIVFNVLEKPNSLDYPVKPKRTLIMAVSFMASLFLGVFVAFLAEWWSNVRKN